MLTREERIELYKSNDPHGYACDIYVEDIDMLICWHGSWHESEQDIYDAYCFSEFFPYSKLVDWQNDIFNTAPYQVKLGQASPSTLRGMWACSYKNPITPEQAARLKKRLGAY